MSRAGRQAAYRRGGRGEMRAALLLRLKGYRILERRWRVPVGEVDLIARKGNLVVFVEVKARATNRAAAESILYRQRRRIERAASAFLAVRPELSGLGARFDAILIAPGRWPKHIKAAWLSGE
ncbi:MAG: YraN family protein [Sphingomonadales bacterium]